MMVPNDFVVFMQYDGITIMIYHPPFLRSFTPILNKISLSAPTSLMYQIRC